MVLTGMAAEPTSTTEISGLLSCTMQLLPLNLTPLSLEKNGARRALLRTTVVTHFSGETCAGSWVEDLFQSRINHSCNASSTGSCLFKVYEERKAKQFRESSLIKLTECLSVAARHGGQLRFQLRCLIPVGSQGKQSRKKLPHYTALEHLLSNFGRNDGFLNPSVQTCACLLGISPIAINKSP